MAFRVVLAALAVLLAWPVAAAPNSVLGGSFAICDPNNPANCLTPNSSGGLPGSGGGSLALTTGTTPQPAPITVGTSATQLAAAAASSTTYVHREFQNTGAGTVYIGPAGVTTATGYPVPAGAVYDFSRLSGALYGVAAASQSAAVLQY